MVDVEERDLAVILLEDHDHCVNELKDLGKVEQPDHLGHLDTGGIARWVSDVIGMQGKDLPIFQNPNPGPGPCLTACPVGKKCAFPVPVSQQISRGEWRG